MVQNTIIGDEAITPTILMERTWGWGTSYPSTWTANGWFWRTDTNILYQNTGSTGTPTWTSRSSLPDHVHAGVAGDGGKLTSATIITLNSIDYPLYQLALM